MKDGVLTLKHHHRRIMEFQDCCEFLHKTDELALKGASIDSLFDPISPCSKMCRTCYLAYMSMKTELEERLRNKIRLCLALPIAQDAA